MLVGDTQDIFSQQMSRDLFLVKDLVEAKATTFGNKKYSAFCYTQYNKLEHRFWQVPKRFKSPKANQNTVWNYWIIWLPDYIETRDDGTIVAHPIIPFWLFQHKMLSKALKTVFKINWKPVLKNYGLCYCEKRLTIPWDERKRSWGGVWFQNKHALIPSKLLRCKAKTFRYMISLWF